MEIFKKITCYTIGTIFLVVALLLATDKHYYSSTPEFVYHIEAFLSIICGLLCFILGKSKNK